jgi:hypothetical protein
VKTQLRNDAEHRALADKVKAGTATDEERLRFEQWPRTTLRNGGTVAITEAPPMTVEQWKAMRPRANAVAREQAAKRREQEEKSNA